jgi:hypothetical protein
MHVGRNPDMKKYPGIRYPFRPESYWSETDPLAAILRNVTGENRRRMIADYWRAGKLEELDPALLRDEAAPETITRLGRIHPSFLGGEYLPAYLPAEVEIARICIQSTTSDVISLRARPISRGPVPSRPGIGYRVVDEYDGVFTLPIQASVEALSLAEVVKQFEDGRLQELDWGGGLALGYNNMNAEDGDFEALRHFTRISSTIYRQLETHFEHVFEDWVRELRADHATTAEEEKEPDAMEKNPPISPESAERLRELYRKNLLAAIVLTPSRSPTNTPSSLRPSRNRDRRTTRRPALLRWSEKCARNRTEKTIRRASHHAGVQRIPSTRTRTHARIGWLSRNCRPRGPFDAPCPISLPGPLGISRSSLRTATGDYPARVSSRSRPRDIRAVSAAAGCLPAKRIALISLRMGASIARSAQRPANDWVVW